MQEKFTSERHLISRNKYGRIDTVVAKEKVILATSVGSLVPRYTMDDEFRKKESPVKFYKTAELKSVPLEEPTEITTPVGVIKSELVTFYQNGALRRIFPLDGQITGYWTEENEFELAETIAIPTSSGTISVKPIYLQFYETGELESILFWPKEQVSIETSLGKVQIHKGICFHKNGKLKGFEPVEELSVESPIGIVKCFDPDPNGLSAEKHALNFYENGEIQSITSPSSQVKVIKNESDFEIFSPKIVTSYCDENSFFLSPLKITFDENSVRFSSADEPPVTVARSLQFEVSDYLALKPIAMVGCS